MHECMWVNALPVCKPCTQYIQFPDVISFCFPSVNSVPYHLILEMLHIYIYGHLS